MSNPEWVPQIWMTAPFIFLLLSIAILPLVAHKFWSRLKNQALVSLGLALPVIFICLRYAPHTLAESVKDYFSFVVLLGSLFVVSAAFTSREI